MRAVLLVFVALGVGLAAARDAWGLSVQEAILRVKPAVALVTAEVQAEVTLNCGRGPVAVTPAPFVETGTGWFVDGRGFLITNAHVVDPAHRMPPWVVHELKKKAIELGCVDPALRAQGLMRGQRPDREEQIRRRAVDQALAGAQITPKAQVSVLLSNGVRLPAQVAKFSPPLLLDVTGRAVEGSGRDLALLRVTQGTYPAIALAGRHGQIGDPVHILGFPGVVLSHELLDKSAALEAVVTGGSISGFKVDQIGQDLIQTDAAAAHGVSGGPLINENSTLVGVITAVSLAQGGGAIVQGFNLAIPVKDVAKFLQGTEVTKPGESEFNQVWFAGVTALFDRRYKLAATKLAEANRLLPGLSDVKRALADAEDKVKNPPPQPFPWAWATLGVTIVSAGAYGGMWGRRWIKNRFRVQPPQVVGFIEAGLSPVLLDVRTKSDYETSPLKLPGAIRIDPDTIATAPLNVEPEQLVIAYCTSPEEACAAQVTTVLRKRGFKKVRILKGGLGGWTNARLPVEAKSHLPSIGLELYKNLTLGDVERRRFKTGDVVFREGDDPHGEAYIIHSGTLEIRRTFDGSERVLARWGEGELVGEMALFRRGTRSATGVAVTDLELIVLREERLEWLIRNRPGVTLEVLKRLSDLVIGTDKERASADAAR